MRPCAPDLPAWNPQSVSRKARRASSGGTSLQPFLGCPLQQGPGHRLPPSDTAAFLRALLHPPPGRGPQTPAGVAWGCPLPGGHPTVETTKLPGSVALATVDQASSGFLILGCPHPPVLISIQSIWTGATERGLGSSAVEGSAEVGRGGVVGGGGGSIWKRFYSGRLSSSLVARPKPPPHTHAGGLGKWKITSRMDWGVFASCSSSSSFFFLFAHKFHLLQHRILVATKGNASLPLMKKLINIHLPSSTIHHELYMNTCLGGQTVSLCVQSI